MSGIYIPGMEVPTQCPCELIGVGYDLYCFAVGGIPARVKEFYECCKNRSKPSWCPLIPVPDHGRLIDADALIKRLKDEKGAYFGYEAAVIGDAIEYAPTIITASKEGGRR